MKITVIGLGYVGAIAAAGLAAAGHKVLGVDIDRERVASLNAGAPAHYEPGLAEWVAAGLRAGNLRFRHPDAVAEDLGDTAIIATGTPPAHGGAADLQQVRAALAWVKAAQPQDLVIVMKSTVPPGTGRRIAERELAGSGLRYLSNPEFLRAGQGVHDWRFPDRIVVGTDSGDERDLDVARQLHSGIDAPLMVTDITSAEMIKYASNAFLATRISFINEIASLCDLVGGSVDEVSRGLAMDARTGARIHAGVGYGGSCFPKDVRALDHLAMTNGASLELLRSVISANNRQRLLPLQSLRKRFNGALPGLKVGVLGLAFKPGTDDVRDAPSLDLIRALAREGVDVCAYDPQANAQARAVLPPSVRFAGSVAECAAGTQALALLTEWPQIVETDWGAVAETMHPPRFVFDGRNALDRDDLQRLGFECMGIGVPPPPPRHCPGETVAWTPLTRGGHKSGRSGGESGAFRGRAGRPRKRGRGGWRRSRG